MKRLAGAGGVALVAAAAAVTVAVSTGTAQVPLGRTIKLTERGGTFAFVDNAPHSRSCKRCEPRPSAGDVFVFTQRMFDEADKRVGTLQGQCTFTRAGSFAASTAQCHVTLHLADGTLALSALANFARKTTTFAIVGGTGAYEGARGSGTSTERSNSDIADDVFHLLP